MEDKKHQEKIDKIQKIYKLYTEKIKELKLRQEKLILDFMKKKEDEEIKKIRQKLKNNY